MAMYQAVNRVTKDVHQFRSLAALARRFGGDDYSLEHSTASRPPSRVMNVLKWDRKVNGSHVLATLDVPTEVVEAAEAAKRTIDED